MTEMSPAEALFFAALAKADPAERAAYLEAACGGDGDLRRRVDRLLAAHPKLGTFLEQAPAGPNPTGAFLPHQESKLPPAAPPDANGPEQPEAVLAGRYKLLEQIGEGGFAVVFLAEQTQPVRRKVALKILKPGMDTRQVVARFEAERQALALMDHPNIAKVHDGGATPSGRPYFVMELVKGVPLTDFCDQSHLTPRQRLQLFVSVCQAVQHAHTKGIIHRDLKPSNVLVTVHDTTPVVKVIDFGIAKALGQELTDKTLFTGFAQMVGTPLYMSPEQAGLSGLDIDTRSDIYSLGVLLYELLTGTTPFPKERFKEAGYDEIRRIIREEEPPRPSTRLSESKGSLPSVSAQRQTEPAKLTKLVRGELDWVVMKCLEKDRNRRYDTANGLAADVQRYLHVEPVQACPPSALYRFRKFARRNTRALAAAAMLGVALLVAVGAVAGSLGWVARDRAAQQAALEQEVNVALKEAEQLQEHGNWPAALSAAKRAEGLLAGAGGDALRPRAHEVRADLEMVLRLEQIRFPQAHADLQSVEATAAAKYAKAFRDYGIDVPALAPQEAADHIRARSICLELAAALDDWARVRRFLGKTDDTIWKRLLAVARAADPDPWRNQVRDALENHNSASLRELAASPKISTLPVQTLSLLGGVLEDLGDDGGADLAQPVLRQAQRKYPGDLMINFQLAWSLEHRPRPQWDEALRFYTAALALRPHHPWVLGRIRHIASSYHRLGNDLHAQKKFDEAATSYRKAIQLDPKNAEAHFHLGNALNDQGKLDEAIPCYREAVVLDPKSWALFPLGNALRQQNKLDEAIACYRQFIQFAPKNGAAHASLGSALAGKGQLDGAIACYKTAIEFDPDTAVIHNNFAWLLATCSDATWRDPIQAVKLARRAVELAPQHGMYWNTLGVAHYRADEWKAAIGALEKSMELQKGGDSFDWFFLAMTNWQLGERDRARQWHEKAVQWMDKHQPKNEELLRFRSEAAELLKIEDGTQPK